MSVSEAPGKPAAACRPRTREALTKMLCWTWTPQRTVYQVVVKARIWFEAYELHLARGAWIDSWLGHAPA